MECLFSWFLKASDLSFFEIAYYSLKVLIRARLILLIRVIEWSLPTMELIYCFSFWPTNFRFKCIILPVRIIDERVSLSMHLFSVFWFLWIKIKLSINSFKRTVLNLARTIIRLINDKFIDWFILTSQNVFQILILILVYFLNNII